MSEPSKKAGFLASNYIFFTSFILLSLLFFFVSDLDIRFSSFFWRPESGFFLKNQGFVVFIYRSVEWVSFFTGSLLLLLFFIFFLRSSLRKTKKARFILFALLLLILGPGLVVNFVFKDHWGRARPAEIKEFGGNKDFTPAFVIGKACKKNCSFVSGHASAIAWILSLSIFYPLNKGLLRKSLLFLAGFYFFLASMGRIVQGGHFLSDVVLAFFFVYLSALILDYMLLRSKDP